MGVGKHREEDKNCVWRFGPSVQGVLCPVCVHYDNAVWLTQRESAESQYIERSS